MVIVDHLDGVQCKPEQVIPDGEYIHRCDWSPVGTEGCNEGLKRDIDDPRELQCSYFIPWTAEVTVFMALCCR